VGRTKVIYVRFLHDVPCQKLFKSANVSRSYSKNNTGTVFWRTYSDVIVFQRWNYWLQLFYWLLAYNYNTPLPALTLGLGAFTVHLASIHRKSTGKVFTSSMEFGVIL